MDKTTLDDVMICPNCNSDDTYSYSTDEIEFDSDGTGHYYVDCTCRACKHNFRLYTTFKYEIIRAHT